MPTVHRSSAVTWHNMHSRCQTKFTTACAATQWTSDPSDSEMSLEVLTSNILQNFDDVYNNDNAGG